MTVIVDNRSHCSVMGGRVVLRPIVGQICIAWHPEDVKLALLDSIFNPIESHVDCFGSFLFSNIVCDVVGG